MYFYVSDPVYTSAVTLSIPDIIAFLYFDPKTDNLDPNGHLCLYLNS